MSAKLLVHLTLCILSTMEELIREWLSTGSINIFGKPFAGKDTQGKILADLLDGVVLSGGDILRNSTIPNHVQETMRSGKLVPTEEYINIVLPYLAQDHFAHQPLILSSVGRWHGEEAGVLQATEQAGHPVKAVIYLNLEDDTVRQRWHNLKDTNDRGDRHDDTLEVLEVRLQEYHEKTLPVIDYYRKKGLLIEIDGHQNPEIVHQTILTALTDTLARQ